MTIMNKQSDDMLSSTQQTPLLSQEHDNVVSRRGTETIREAVQVLEQSDAVGGGVQLQQVSKAYSGVTALQHFNLDIRPGEMVVLLGRSGCGKTTALRSLAGLEDIDSGRIVVGGRDVTGVPTNKRDMAMVFQAYSLFPHMTALQNVAFGLQVRGMTKSQCRSKAGEMLDLVGLGDQSSKYTHQMSGGQQQRVALARALAISPKVLLLDEPLSALDAKVRVSLREEIRRIQLETGTTTLFVTHDQEEALAVADRVGVMNAGRIEQIDAPQQLYQSPRSEFVATFIGLTNRLPGQLCNGGGEAMVFGQRVPLVQPLNDDASSDAVIVLVRPESLALSLKVEAVEHQMHGAPARVTDIQFLGAVIRVTCDLHVEHNTIKPTELVVVQLSASEMIPGLVPGAEVLIAPRPVAALAIR
ncbi:ABC transporter ATP-binding protein [Bifidobacterium sp.]|jgi:putative spermidine/putrescine transport system ATP-binding protein|uniref:ABC transporter ATP-binding protein n=1 Tax=Bifidobacterium sp. TaxID=41200 RepID=UPI0025C601DD|nr:ABC transporter ATP-binding protein [Bifidobacterium sp.]MCI1636369.1 ABC transporter ATP-binding protein [Bifidobacterium sp.]